MTADLIFLVIRAGGSSTEIVPCGESSDFDIFAVGIWRSMMPRADRRKCRLRHDQRVAEAMVEAQRHIAGELHVLALVVADRHLVGVVEQDVGRHQDRIVEQPDARRLLAFGLLFELRHAAQLAERGHAVEDPGEPAVLRHVALHEQDAALRVEAGGHEQRRELTAAVGELIALVRHRHRMEVDDAIHGVVAVLVVDPAANGPQVVAEMQVARGFDAGEHACHWMPPSICEDASDPVGSYPYTARSKAS